MELTMGGPLLRYRIKISKPPGFGSDLYLELCPSDETWTLAKPFASGTNLILGKTISGKIEVNYGYGIWIIDGFGRRRFFLKSLERLEQVGGGGEITYGKFLGNGPEAIEAWLTWENVGLLRPGATGCWFGFAIKGGAMGALAGAEIAIGVVFSLDTPRKMMVFIMTTGRVGIGLGASGGASAVLVTNVRSVKEMQSIATSGTDWTVAIGAKIGKAAEATSEAIKVLKACWVGRTFLDQQKLIKAINAADFVASLSKHVDSIAGLGKTIFINSNIDPDVQSVSMLDLPWPSGGAELSWYRYDSVVNWAYLGNPMSNVTQAKTLLGERASPAQQAKIGPRHQAKIGPRHQAKIGPRRP
jgi:hypothetical protein